MKRLMSLFLVVFAFAGWLGTEMVGFPKEVVAKAGCGDIDILSVLTKARTAKAFTDEEVRDEDLEIILQARINALSARNRQPWHFSVVRDRAILEEIEQSVGFALPGGVAQPPRRLFLSSAKVAIVVSGTDE
ncbi:MAG: nitroreductase family protein [Candidatus Caldatribacteriaceae bacterium]